MNALDFTLLNNGLGIIEVTPSDTTQTPGQCELANGRKELAIYFMAMGRVSSVIQRIKDTFPNLRDSEIGLEFDELNLRAYKIY